MLNWLFKNNKKTIVHKAYNELPYFTREVIVQREYKSVPPFSAYLSSNNERLCWLGTCGEKKDKHLVICPEDTWYYSE